MGLKRHCPSRTTLEPKTLESNKSDSDKPTVCLGVTSSVAYTYGYDDGRIAPTHCALIAGRLGGRWSRCQVCRTPPAGAHSAHSGLGAGSRLASTADPGGFHRPKTIPRSASMPCDDASLPTSALGTRPCPLPPCPF